jgi:tetratricopeptide (TPR) repeat protein
MLKFAALVITVGLSQTAHADVCPPTTDNVTEKARLHDELHVSPTEMSGRVVSDQLWIIWTTAPDETSQDLLDRGRERIRVADYEGAEEFFDDLIGYCPDYAEGWNQRAFVHHLRQNYVASLADITVVLALEPRHFGALAGRATVLLSMGRTKVGNVALREALKVNPWLIERHQLSNGEDI